MAERDAWAALGSDPFATGPVRESVRCGEVMLRRGSRVRLRPQGRADVLDIVLRDRVATVESIEVDFEDRVHLAVTVDDDPGNDLGAMRQPGHRFFFSLADVVPVTEGAAAPERRP